MRYLKDKLGRVKFTQHTQRPIQDFKPNGNQVAWMQFLNLHGPLSSHYLHALTPKNKDDFSRSLKQLFDGQMVLKPIKQRNTEYPDGHLHVYDLTDKGEKYLKAHDLWVEAVRPTGAWVHQFMVASITASVDLLCRAKGYRYIPPHEYLHGAPMASYVPFEWDFTQKGGGKYRQTISDIKLIPDAVFAIDYGDESYIAYALEADRNSEPNRPEKHDRKSDLRSIRQYQNFIGEKMYRQAYLRDAKMILLYVTVSKGHAENFLDLVHDEIKKPTYIAVAVEDAFDDPFYPPKLLTFDEGFERAGYKPFFLDPAGKEKPPTEVGGVSERSREVA